MHEFMSPEMHGDIMCFAVRVYVLLHEIYHAEGLRPVTCAEPVVGEQIYEGEYPHHVPVECLIETMEWSLHLCWKHKGIMHGKCFLFEARNIS